MKQDPLPTSQTHRCKYVGIDVSTVEKIHFKMMPNYFLAQQEQSYVIVGHLFQVNYPMCHPDCKVLLEILYTDYYFLKTSNLRKFCCLQLTTVINIVIGKRNGYR